MNPHANDIQGRIRLPPVKIWRHNIIPYLNTGDRHTMRQTGQRIAENTPQTPCTPWECVRIPLCLNKCDTFGVKARQLLTDFLWTLHSFADTHKSMVVQFEMMDLELLLWWTPGLGLFVHRDDVPKPPPRYLQLIVGYYQRVIARYFSEITAAADTYIEHEEPFKLQLTIQADECDLSELHKAVRDKFCRPQPLMGNLYVYDVSTPVSVSILITDYPPIKARTTIPLNGGDMGYRPQWESYTV